MNTHSHGWTLGLLLAAALWGSAGASAQERAIKIGVIDLDQVAAESPKGKELQAQLESFQREVQAEAEPKVQAANDIRRRMAEGANTLSSDKLAELQKDYEDLAIAIRRLQDDMKREVEIMQRDGLREVEKQLGPVFEAITNAEGYDLILNRQPGIVVMVSPRVDITQMVIDRLRAEASEN